MSVERLIISSFGDEDFSRKVCPVDCDVRVHHGEVVFNIRGDADPLDAVCARLKAGGIAATLGGRAVILNYFSLVLHGNSLEVRAKISDI